MRKRATKQQIAVSLGLLALIAGAAWFWWPHVYFRFQLERNEVHIPRVSVKQLTAPGKTDGWADCRIGPVSLKLPLELAEKGDRSVGKMTIDLSTFDRILAVDVPRRVGPNELAQRAKVIDEFQMSPARLIAESYRTGTDDFRWTMSHAELRRHQTLLSMGANNFPHSHVMTVETRFEPQLEGVLIQGDRQTAVFHWQATSGAAVGALVFRQKEGDLDLDWVRDVCQSVACDESRLGENALSKADLRELLETIEVRPAGGEEKEK
jgi:hypothetical protein